MSTQRVIDESDDPEALVLGRHIRAIRAASGMTLEVLARASDVSPSLISQVERGLTSPSVTSLRRIARALDVPLGSLFVEQTHESRDVFDDARQQLVVRVGERKRLQLPRSRVRYELLTPDLNRQIEFLWIEYEPAAVTHPEPMGHPGEENALCVEGSVVVTIEGQEFLLKAGDSISFDSARPHQVENRSTVPAVIISAITPPAF